MTTLVINHAWLGHKLVAALGDGSALGVSIHWSAEESALETAGGIVQALPLLGSEPFLVINGDTWLDLDYRALVNQPLGDDLAHLWLVPNPPQHPQGDFSLQAGRVLDTPALTFSGVGLYHPAAFAGLPCGRASWPPAARLDGAGTGGWQPAGWRVARHRHSGSAARAGRATARRHPLTSRGLEPCVFGARCLAPSSVFCSATSSVPCWACGSAIASIGAWGSAGLPAGTQPAATGRLFPCHLRRHGPHRQGERPGHRARNTGRVQPDGQDAAGRRAAGTGPGVVPPWQGGGLPLRETLAEFRQASLGQRDILRFFLEVQLQAAFADGQVEANERAILQTIADELGFSRIELARILAMAEAQMNFFHRQQQQGSGQGSNTARSPPPGSPQGCLSVAWGERERQRSGDQACLSQGDEQASP